jgi:hypothetical protein
MEHGICLLGLIPVRAEPDDRSEMTTQIIFGECYTVTEKQGRWARIITSYDQYEGWIDGKQIIYISQQFHKVATTNYGISLEKIFPVHSRTRKTKFLIPTGSSFPGIDESIFLINTEEFQFNGRYLPPGHKTEKNTIIAAARNFLNTPYLWGGRTHMGIDCSGFTQIVYKLIGTSIQRDTSQQAEQGETINFLSEAEPGDLLFFDNDEGIIVHTGILMEDNKIIHASGHVRIDNIDHYGIFKKEDKTYTHQLRLIKRIVSD